MGFIYITDADILKDLSILFIEQRISNQNINLDKIIKVFGEKNIQKF